MATTEEPIVDILACERQIVRSASYFWENRARGGPTGMMVIQRTRSGRGFLETGTDRQFVSTGQAMLFRHGEDTRYGYAEGDTEPYELDFLAFKGQVAEPLFESVRGRWGAVLAVPAKSEASLLLSEILNAHQERAFGDRFQRSLKVLELLYALMRPPAPSGPADPVEAAREYIANHFDRSLRIKEVADAVGLSREHLTRLYRERYGEGPGEHCRRLRLQRARDLLQATSEPLHAIARKCGYSDADTLARAVDKAFGPEARIKR